MGGKNTAARIAIAALVLTLPFALLTSPASYAATYDAGTVVAASDYDATVWPSGKSDTVSLCAVDTNGDGALDSGEPLYIDVDSVNTCAGLLVEPKDIRLTASGDLKPGKEVKTADGDAGDPFIGPIAHFLRYFDTAGDSSWGSKSVLYLDLMDLASSKVSVGDVRLTKFDADHGPFTWVQSSDPDLGISIADAHATQNTIISAGGTGHVLYKAGSAWYLNPKAASTADGISSTDVRLTDKANMPPEVTLGPITIAVKSLALRQTEVAPGAPFQVLLGVENTGSGTGAGLVETKMGDDIVDARGTPTLAPKGTSNLVVTLVAPLKAGDVKIAAGDQSVTLKVTAPAASAATSVTAPLPAPETSAQAAGEKPAAEPPARAEAGAAPFVLVLFVVVGALVVTLRTQRTR